MFEKALYFYSERHERPALAFLCFSPQRGQAVSDMNAKVITIGAPDWTPAESYGRVARELTKGFRALGYHVNTLGHKAPEKRILPAAGGIVMAYPTNFGQWGPMLQYGPRIAITMFESTDLPPGWADALNHCDRVVVPSTFLVDVFRQAGVTRPIHVIPLGVSANFHYVQRSATRTPYTFLTIGDRGKRKGWHLAGFAFQKVFGDDPSVQLLIKTRPGALPFTISNPNIHMVADEMSDKRLALLYATADCMVVPTLGEGFGLPPREFAATGGPVIATDFSGTADNLTDWGMPLGYSLVKAWEGDTRLEHIGYWAEPDVEELGHLMRYMVQHRSWSLERGARAAQFIKHTYRWRRFVERVNALWEELTDGD
jgi:glycosyltransferase involved in cell wall biosynthesis